MSFVVVRYHEIALKRGNRTWFVNRLAANIQRLLRDVGIEHVDRGPGRLVIPLDDDTVWPAVRTRLARVFGIANFLLCQRGERRIDDLCRQIAGTVSGTRRSFAIRVKRADKSYPLESPEICRRLGRAVQDATGWPVDLSNPELEIHIEVLPQHTFVAFEKVDGPGGLPVGTSGRVVTLLSGGIDSPIAAHRMMQRGCRIEFVHFHGAPFQDRTSQEKVADLLRILVQWQGDARLHLVPFGLIQQQIVAQVTRPIRVVLYRRMMMRIAEALAYRVEAEALVTGESLGQVASQTLPNLAVIEAAANLPILRPLIGMDKLEITQQAHRLGTFDISIQPDQDCCQLFVPKHPATRVGAAEAAEAEEPLDIAALVGEAVRQTQTLTFRCDAPAPAADVDSHPAPA